MGKEKEKQSKRPDEIAYSKGLECMNRGDYIAARDQFTHAINLRPEVVYYENRAEVYLRLKHFTKAAKSAQAALRLEPMNAKIWKILTEACVGMKSKEQVIFACLSGLSCQDPEYQPFFETHLMEAYASVTFDKTLLFLCQDTNKAEEQTPEDNQEESEDQLKRQLAELHEQSERAREIWSQEMSNQEARYQQQCAEVRKLEDMVASLAKENEDLTEQKVRSENLQEALKSELQGLRRKQRKRFTNNTPSPSQLSTQVSSVFSGESLTPLAARDDVMEVKSATLNAEAITSYSEFHLFTALAALDEAIEIDPQNAVLYANRAGLYCTCQKFNLALPDAEKCVQLDPTYARGWYLKGLCHYNLTQPDKAYDALVAEVEVYHKRLSDIDNQQLKLRPDSGRRPFPLWSLVVMMAVSFCGAFRSAVN
eukprot:Protomagalhaensia_sp_Gyna_25__5299@NODE_660_length_2896_cov_11_351768_g515_i0_p2_GENE_NODE_660_length_2896_cov_11_351768_g515_i0NODE_660_length_2896_cov_11_351768_g515_i0_p2_ORF_typecomplete_len424_score68_31TPR_9/PF13371_6/5_8TPR_9/PF13371_6/0_00043TPR_9/PF13371_6/0_0027TPR_9/PF13371_6/5_1e05TPR_11/PF13414_6/0_00023TPR_11/PF13414_6/13TPR_11/PF13414_6/1_3e03TPR_11/PF13414_6/4_9e05TPR_11/PF13414_6/0_078TPR_16/PF13432_6/0_0001TPR_16/PF13432_6/0_00066TPR_16/PF13432_6/0_88TPR_16/PF13432_6/2_5e05TPR_